MPQFERKPLAAAILVMFSAPVAMAQAQAPSTKPAAETTLPAVKVQERPASEDFKVDSTRGATRTETPLRDIPQFINIVPQALIRSQGATSLNDALRNVPGISYGAAEGGTQNNNVYFLRGFPLNGDIFVDGVRDLGEYNRDLFATESIEVLKGSSALMFGRGSTGGLINQVSKVADRLPRAEVAAALGSFEQKRLTADLNLRPGESSAVRLIALGENSGSYRYPQGVERAGFAPSYWLNIGNATDVTLSYYYLNEKSVIDYGQPTKFFGGTFSGFPDVGPRTYYGYADRDYANYETHIATFKLEHEFSKALSLRNTLRWARYLRESESTIAQGVTNNPATTPINLLTVSRNHDSGRTRDNDDDTVINQTELTWKTATGSVKHTVLAGLELARENLNRWNYTLAGTTNRLDSYLAPNPYLPLSYTKTLNVRSLAEADTAAVYVQDQLELTREWKALFGLRYEHYKSEATTQTIATGATATGPFSRTENLWSGRAGLIWQPTQRQSYYVSYGNSYNPSGELGVYGATGTNLSAVNQNIDPEEARNYEVGAQWDVLTGLQLRTSIFRNEKNNARFVDPTGATVLSGKRRVDGVELEVAGSITQNWDIYSGIAFMNGEILSGAANTIGKTPLGVADVQGNVWTIYRLGGGWEVGGGLRGQSGTWLTDANQPGSQIPDYAVVDATIAYVQKQYEIRLNAYNLADKTYYFGGYNNNPNRVLPGMPRAASVTLRYNFN
jgi:catecholate siderophore receptor